MAAQALEFAAERLSQVQTVQVFAAEAREAAAFRGLSASGLDLAERYAAFQGAVEGAGRLAVNVGTVALLGLGGLLVVQGKLSVGALLAGGRVGLRAWCSGRESGGVQEWGGEDVCDPHPLPIPCSLHLPPPTCTHPPNPPQSTSSTSSSR